MINTIQFYNITGYETPLPKRSTWSSAGYDFYMPHNLTLMAKETKIVKTGIKCKIPEGHFLMIVPRSSLGIKHGLALANTVGIIDADYYNNPDNEGHIMIALHNTNEHLPIHLKKGDRVVQGIVLPFLFDQRESKEDFEKRTSGIGSTGK